MSQKHADSLPKADAAATIMVVDDDTYIVDILDELLSREGYRVRSDSVSESALRSILADPPDLVLLDIRMPGMDGFSLCRAIKQDPVAARVPVIFLSGLYEAEDKVRAFEVGGVDYLTKPFSDIEILARLRAQLRLHRLQSDLEQQVAQRTSELQEEIAERRRAEEQRERLLEELQRKNRELEQFAYSVSHDLSTPMISIRGFLARLEQDIAAGDEAIVLDDIRRIAAAAEKMQRMLEEVLELSRIGRLINPPQTVSLRELALEATEAFAEQIGKGGVRLDVAADMPAASVDRARLMQVYQNLIGNALNHAGIRQGLHIEIGGEVKGEEVVCFVRDNGKGIDPRFHGKIFGLFERLDPKAKGTGVGLALCRRIIEAHGGRIWVESAGEGKGATFYFTLQRMPEPS